MFLQSTSYLTKVQNHISRVSFSWYPFLGSNSLQFLLMSYALTIQDHRLRHIEPTNPLFIQPLDNLGRPLVLNIFNRENYDNWKRPVILALSAKHKIAFIDCSCPRTNSTSPWLTLWQRNNAMVLSWLVNSLSENIRNNVLYFEITLEL